MKHGSIFQLSERGEMKSQSAAKASAESRAKSPEQAR